MKGWVLGLCLITLMLAGCNLRTTDYEETIPLTPAPEVIQTQFTPPPARTPVITFSQDVIDHIRTVYAYGQTLGNRPNVFSKVGDSITVSGNFLHEIGNGVYTLGDYADLQPVIDYFSAETARTGNSFNNRSLAATVGWSAFAALNPANAEFGVCAAGETPLACEYRTVKPAIALIMFGTNDVGYRSTEEYRGDLELIIAVSEQMGVIPVLSTIPPRPDIPNEVNAFNAVVAELTQAHHLPMWDYYSAVVGLPNYGLTSDYVHPSTSPWGTTFTEQSLRYGYTVRNLTALQMLDSLWIYLAS